MNTIQTTGIKYTITSMLCLTIFFINGISYAEEKKYPMKVTIITRDQAKYDTPENTLSAIRSALVNEDLEWSDETLTQESLEEQRRLLEKAGIDPKVDFNLEKDVKDTFIIDKIEYKDAVVLIVEDQDKDGSIIRMPFTFVQENGKWKMTNKFSGDEELHEYLDYIKPEEIISSTIKINPNRWNLNWYNWIKEHMEEKEWIRHFAEKVTILCMIADLKDNQGKPYSVKEIVPETILFNYLLPPQPWRFNSEEKVALIVKSKENRYFKKRKGFKEWQNRSRLLKKYKSPVLLVKFNKFKAMETLPEMSPGKEYEVIISGELKNGKRFKGTTKIIITGWNAKHRWKWNHPDWLNSEKDIDNWWNKENDFEDWWKKTIKKQKRQNNRKEKGDSRS
ncbi:MAG: hypothetical protein K8R11_11545 [Methanococcoides sp.]|nr:hypothetical protein [Methanococcoides sp.]